MKKEMKNSGKVFLKMALVALISLVLLIPLEMIKQRVWDRQQTRREALDSISYAWGGEISMQGPLLTVEYEGIDQDKHHLAQYVYPEDLKIDVKTESKELHRSIYDVMVYIADIHVKGNFIVPKFKDTVRSTKVTLEMNQLKGIEGDAILKIDGQETKFLGMEAWKLGVAVELDREKIESSEPIDFEIYIRSKGTESIYFTPVGGMTEVNIEGDCPTPSFKGAFLPSEREVRNDGYTAQWKVSQVNRGNPTDTHFGVELMPEITQYQQTTRCVKYAILIILLVFVMCMIVEFVTKREIVLGQYVVIGLSLVLFYALLLGFSELVGFGWAYLIAMAMTVGALTAYFRGILKNGSAWALGVMTTCAYGISYVLLQMEIYGFLTGTLILFVILSVIMWFTRNLGNKETTEEKEEKES